MSATRPRRRPSSAGTFWKCRSKTAPSRFRSFASAAAGDESLAMAGRDGASRSRLGGDLQQHVGEVLSLRHQKAVRNLCGNLNDVTCSNRMALAALDPRPGAFTGAPAGLLVQHFAAKKERRLAALCDHDVDDVVVLFRKAVGITVDVAKTVIAVVGERLARGMVRTDLL